MMIFEREFWTPLATGICPRDDISVGEINNNYTWKDDELCYGTFEHRRNKVLEDVENGRLHIFVGGHSHRNVVMRLNKNVKNPIVLAAGEKVFTNNMTPSRIVMVSSSGGPFPKYLPGAPLICACQNYETGFYYEWKKPSFSDLKLKQLYAGGDFSKKALPTNSCPHCQMEGDDMIRKPARRHTPGGNLLIFEHGKNGRVRIETVLAENAPNDPNNRPTKARTAVMCEEQDVFMGDMRLDGINSYEEFNKWYDTKPIRIISEKSFKYYGYMVFPSRVKYVTFNKGVLPGDDKVKVDQFSSENKYEVRVRQTIIRDSFNDFFIAAKHDSDFGFTRYTFEGSDIWDREINIDKSHSAAIADDWEKEKTDKYNNRQRIKAAFNRVRYGDPYEPELKEAKYDEFEGMVLKFRTIPDFKKRKKTNVCGY